MDKYKFIVTVFDTGLYSDREEAQQAADEWAAELAEQQDCEVSNVQVDLVEPE